MSNARSVAALGLLGAGMFLAFKSSASALMTPQFSAAEFQALTDSSGYLNLTNAFKPATNSGEIGVNGLFGVRAGLGDTVGYDGDGSSVGYDPGFDWGAYQTEYEFWGEQGQVAVTPEMAQIIQTEGAGAVTVDDLIIAVADWLKPAEAFVGYVYDDVNGLPWSQSKKGNPTVGYGHVVKAGESLDWTMSEQEGYLLLLADVRKHLGPIIPYVKVPLTVPQWVAIASLAFNAGPSAVAKSQFLQAVNRMDWGNAEAQFKDWNKATVVVDGQKVKRVVRGLTNRREREWALFTTLSQVVMISGSNYA